MKLTACLFLALCIWGCENDNLKKPQSSIDTTQSVRINGYWATPLKSIDFNTFVETEGDTLQFAICSDYIFHPFGPLKDSSSLKFSPFENYNVLSYKRDTSTNSFIQPPILLWHEYIQLQNNKSNIHLFFDNDPEASRHGYIRGGYITDVNLVLVNGIKIGISKYDFFKIFFEKFPTELMDQYDVIKIESCVTDIIHVYQFKNESLYSIRFISV